MATNEDDNGDSATGNEVDDDGDGRMGDDDDDNGDDAMGDGAMGYDNDNDVVG